MLVFFPPHNEDKFPLSNEMSCLHFWAGTKLPLPQRKNQTQGLAVLFKSQRNRFKLVECLHIPLAIWVMFQSKRKLVEEMLSLGTQSCFHAIHVPQLSQSEALNLSYLSSTSCLSLLHPHILTFTSIIFLSLCRSVSPIQFKRKLAGRDSCKCMGKLALLLHQKAMLRCAFQNLNLTGSEEVSMSRDLRAAQEFQNKGRQMPPSPSARLSVHL